MLPSHGERTSNVVASCKLHSTSLARFLHTLTNLKMILSDLDDRLKNYGWLCTIDLMVEY